MPENPISTLEFHPVDQDRLADFQGFMEARGGPHYCWCMAWRNGLNGAPKKTKPEKKAAISGYVEAGVPIGLLGYDGATPVAWCSVAPRDTYRKLGGDTALNQVWSIACFFVQRPYRKKGVARQLVEAACHYARENGAHFLEAYPVDPNAESPSYRFMGYLPMFLKMGFTETGRAGARRYVVLKDLRK
ncbi:MAG: GNAT family N-acetyltransferase [Bacteroidota bacterium]